MLFPLKLTMALGKVKISEKKKVQRVMAYRYCKCSSFPSSGARCPERFELPKSLPKYEESEIQFESKISICISQNKKTIKHK